MSRTLRPYQAECVEAIFRALETDESTCAVLATGLGKTVVMAHVAKRWDKGNTLLLAHRTELLDQAADKFAPELGYRPSVEQAHRGIDAGADLWRGGFVLVGSVQTLRNDARLRKFEKTPFDLLMVDECHHATTAEYRKVIGYLRSINPNLKVVGVTATPNRADKTALGTVFRTVAYQFGIGPAIAEGWLVPIRQEFVTIAGVDFDACAQTTNEFGESDLRAEDLERVLVEEEALHALAVPLLEKAAGRKTLVFTAGVAHAHQLAAVLNRYRKDSAKAVDGKTDKVRERPEAVRDFSEGSLQFLVNFGVFTEGFDAPECQVVAMGRPTKSLGLYTQMLGRGLRPLDGVADGWSCAEDRKMAVCTSAKPFMTVLDFVGNSQHKLCSAFDVLGGHYDQATRDLARAEARRRGVDAAETLGQAAALARLLREQEERRAIKAGVAYVATEVDPFSPNDDGPGLGTVDQARGGATDGQIGFLVGLGVDAAEAARYSKGQAGAVISRLKERRCTSKQRAILEKHGYDPDVPFAEASRLIDALAANGWKRPADAG